MARRLPVLKRVLGPRALFSVAYGEVASSIYFALGIVALHALGLTPWVMLAVGALLVIVSLSYSEATAAIPEAGGSANVARRAFNDLVGFGVGWVTILDYLLVLAIAAFAVPHYLGAALHLDALQQHPWDVLVAVGAVAGVAADRILRGAGRFRVAWLVPVLDVITQGLLVGLGFAFLFSTDVLTKGIDLGTTPTWGGIAFALPLAFLAYTGLETVSNLAREASRPEELPRSVIPALGLVAVAYVLIGWIAISVMPLDAGGADAGLWLHAPLVGIVAALDPHLPGAGVAVLKVFVGLAGAVVLLLAAASSMSGLARLAQALGERGQLPRALARVSRRSLVPPVAIVGAAGMAIALIVYDSTREDDVAFLASLFSFGVLLAFTVTQLAVIRLRFREPGLERPFRVPLGVRVRGVEVPLPAVVGAGLTFAVWIAALATHEGARYAGPLWLAGGLLLYVRVRRTLGQSLVEQAVVVADGDAELPPAGRRAPILVPAKLGIIGEEMVATAIRLAHDGGATVHALHVIPVPLDTPLDAELFDEEERAAGALAEARLLGAENGVHVDATSVRARSIGDAIVRTAREIGAQTIVMGSAPRWRRQSRFFSPTVEHVLRHAPCEVVVVAFPQGVIDEEEREGA